MPWTKRYKNSIKYWAYHKPKSYGGKRTKITNLSCTKCKKEWQMQGKTLVINKFAFEKPNQPNTVSVCISCREDQCVKK